RSRMAAETGPSSREARYPFRYFPTYRLTALSGRGSVHRGLDETTLSSLSWAAGAAPPAAVRLRRRGGPQPGQGQGDVQERAPQGGRGHLPPQGGDRRQDAPARRADQRERRVYPDQRPER